MGLAAYKIALFLLLIEIMEFERLVESAPQVPCLFIFGDSLVDNGNNNELRTLGKANYPPYGIDFPQGPTGRFTNGRNMADILAKLLGFDSYIPPFAATRGITNFHTGVNYASALAGIRQESGHTLGERISLDQQLQNHNHTISGMSQERLSECLYYFVVGSNDYLNNYYLPQYYSTSKMYTPQEYATTLVQHYSQQLTMLYHFGARKISVSGLAPLGCLPAVLARGTNGSACDELINDAARLFNDELKSLVNALNANLADAKFIYIKAMDLRPVDLFAPGMRLLSEPCCKLSKPAGTCSIGQTPCPVRDLHLFYDSVHPTEIVHKVVATAAYFEILQLIS